MRAEETRSHTEPTGSSDVRHDWSGEDVRVLFHQLGVEAMPV